VAFERNLDSFRAKQELPRSAHPILWIYIDFSTVESSTMGWKAVWQAIWRQAVVQHRSWLTLLAGSRKPCWWSTGVQAGRGRGRIRAAGFVVVVNKFVYKLVVIVNAQSDVDKKGFLHNVNGLRSR
jgi:hypothetical protein